MADKPKLSPYQAQKLIIEDLHIQLKVAESKAFERGYKEAENIVKKQILKRRLIDLLEQISEIFDELLADNGQVT